MMLLRMLIALAALGGEVYAFKRMRETGDGGWVSLGIVLGTVVVVMAMWSANAEGWL